MKIKSKLVAGALLMLAIFNLPLATSHAQTTAFTLQGRLNSGASAANGNYDLTFAVYDAALAGNKIAGPITNSTVAVSNGLFTVSLDFGAGVFTGTNYWVQMAVSPAGANTFTALIPRQQLTPAPYALSLVAPQVNALCPPGSVMAYMGTNAPPGWLMCDGSVVPKILYPALFAVIGTASGNGNGSTTTFNLPDLRGVFLRGVNGARSDGLGDPGDGRTTEFTGGNSGNAVGSYQADMFAAHNHAQNVFVGYDQNVNIQDQEVGSGDAAGTFGRLANTLNTGGSETRPKNVYVNYIIKY